MRAIALSPAYKKQAIRMLSIHGRFVSTRAKPELLARAIHECTGRPLPQEENVAPYVMAFIRGESQPQMAALKPLTKYLASVADSKARAREYHAHPSLYD